VVERQEGMKHFVTRNTLDLSLAKYLVAQGVCERGLTLKYLSYLSSGQIAPLCAGTL
jgi:hypothetical protein